MALPSSGQISFNDVRVEFSQSLAPKYTMSDWTAGMHISGSGAGTNVYTPVNLRSSESRFNSPLSLRFNPYSNNDLDNWYSYNNSVTMSDDQLTTGDFLYTHTGINHCFPSSFVSVDVGTTNKILYITISGSADYFYENVYVVYGKPWESNGTGSGAVQLITASGHYYYPYTGDINLEFEYDYKYTASLGQNIYFVIYGDYCGNYAAL